MKDEKDKGNVEEPRKSIVYVSTESAHSANVSRFSLYVAMSVCVSVYLYEKRNFFSCPIEEGWRLLVNAVLP